MANDYLTIAESFADLDRRDRLEVDAETRAFNQLLRQRLEMLSVSGECRVKWIEIMPVPLAGGERSAYE